MNLTCDIVLDLISIYKDGAASEGTAAAVEAHLRQCRDCRQYYRQYDSINRLVSRKQQAAEEAPGGDYEKLSSSLRHRHALTVAFMSGCGAVALGSLLLALLPRKRKQAPTGAGD